MAGPVGTPRQTALVTGAAGGIGTEVVRILIERGMSVMALDRDESGLAALRSELPDHVTTFCVDVTDSRDVDQVVDVIESEHAAIRVLVNGAGVLRTGSLIDMDDTDWHLQLAVNTTGVFNVCRAVGRRMMARRSGSIVTISSNAGGIPRASMAGYSASKSAATMLTKSLGLELGPYGIRCNVVAPGSTATPMLSGMGVEESTLIAGSPGNFKSGIPLGKIAQPRDIAETVAFLSSAQASHITLEEIYVDGGAAFGG